MGLFFLIQKKQLHLNNDPRIISVHILTKVLLKNQNLKEEFDAQVSCLNKRDRAFAKNLVYDYRGVKIKGTRNEAGWNAVYSSGKIIEKIGPILAINNKEVPNHHVVEKTN